MATSKFEVAADRWPQITSKPGEPLKVTEHRKGDVVEVDADQYANLIEAGALVEAKGRKARKATQSPDQGSGSGEGDTFDPAEHTVDEVQAYIAEHPDEQDAVIAAEKAGKNRSGIVGE